MKQVIIAPFQDDTAPLFAGIREFPTEKIILITPLNALEKAEQAKKELARFRIPVEIEIIQDENSLEETFAAFAHIKAKEKGKQLMVNLSSGGGMLGCAALSASFVNGLKAFEFMDDKLIVFPILKFSYYDLLSEKKLDILRLLKSHGKMASLEAVSKALKLGPSLVNYHLYGNEKNPGLKELGLVEVERAKGKISLQLTPLGNLLQQETERKKSGQGHDPAPQ